MLDYSVKTKTWRPFKTYTLQEVVESMVYSRTIIINGLLSTFKNKRMCTQKKLFVLF